MLLMPTVQVAKSLNSTDPDGIGGHRGVDGRGVVRATRAVVGGRADGGGAGIKSHIGQLCGCALAAARHGLKVNDLEFLDRLERTLRPEQREHGEPGRRLRPVDEGEPLLRLERQRRQPRTREGLGGRARAVRAALELDPRSAGVIPSTKGSL